MQRTGIGTKDATALSAIVGFVGGLTVMGIEMIDEAKQVAQRLREMHVPADTIDALVLEVERLTKVDDGKCKKHPRYFTYPMCPDCQLEKEASVGKVDVEPVAYHYCYTNAFGHPVWGVGFHVPSDATEWHDLVPVPALAALRAENERLKARCGILKSLRDGQSEHVAAAFAERDTLRAQLEQAQADAARLREALRLSLDVMETVYTIRGTGDYDPLAVIDAARAALGVK